MKSSVDSFAVNEPVRLPPGPRSRVLSTVTMLRDYVSCFKRWRARYGPVFTIYQAGTESVVVLADPDLVAQLLRADHPERFGPASPASFDALVGPSSVLLREGLAHRQVRKVLSAPLCAGRLARWAPPIAEQTLRSFRAGSPETVFSALERSRELMLSLIIHIVFGADDQRGPRLHAAITNMLAHLHPSIMFMRAAQRHWLGLAPYARYAPASAAFDAQLYQLIEHLRSKPSLAPDCVLASLLRARNEQGEPLEDVEIRDQLRTMLIGGHETTANALAWCLYFIYRDPKLMHALREDLRARAPSPEAGLASPLLRATIDETLRIRPIAGQLFRPLRKPMTLGPWRLPAGAAASPSVLLLHHDPDLWPEPERFDPDRFMGARPKPQIYLPFGAGSHRCLGAAFARFELNVALTAILRELELELLDTEAIAWVQHGLPLGPGTGVRMKRRA